jgi:phosphatidylserine/phosphatidylglycerophosphate/cardiolipin synthase-like enzyme
MDKSSRPFFLHGKFGERQYIEALSASLIGLIMNPDKIWLVSAWVTDFDLLDNRSGHWDIIQPSWGLRYVTFSELLVAAVESGCQLNFVSNRRESNEPFYMKLKLALGNSELLKRLSVDTVHTKGLLCSSFFFKGSMNYTYSGTHINDELNTLTIDSDEIAETQLEFKSRYDFG